MYDLQITCSANIVFLFVFIFQIMIKSLFQCDNAYKVPNLRIKGHLCKTNIPSNTAFRGFGAPQAMLTIEHCIMDISVTLGIPPIKVSSLNTTSVDTTEHSVVV